MNETNVSTNQNGQETLTNLTNEDLILNLDYKNGVETDTGNLPSLSKIDDIHFKYRTLKGVRDIMDRIYSKGDKESLYIFLLLTAYNGVGGAGGAITGNKTKNLAHPIYVYPRLVEEVLAGMYVDEIIINNIEIESYDSIWVKITTLRSGTSYECEFRLYYDDVERYFPNLFLGLLKMASLGGGEFSMELNINEYKKIRLSYQGSVDALYTVIRLIIARKKGIDIKGAINDLLRFIYDNKHNWDHTLVEEYKRKLNIADHLSLIIPYDNTLNEIRSKINKRITSLKQYVDIKNFIERNNIIEKSDTRLEPLIYLIGRDGRETQKELEEELSKTVQFKSYWFNETNEGKYIIITSRLTLPNGYDFEKNFAYKIWNERLLRDILKIESLDSSESS